MLPLAMVGSIALIYISARTIQLSNTPRWLVWAVYAVGVASLVCGAIAFRGLWIANQVVGSEGAGSRMEALADAVGLSQRATLGAWVCAALAGVGLVVGLTVLRGSREPDPK